MSERLFRIRIVLAAFVVGLVISGVTAFPLLKELELLARLLGIAPDATPASLSGLQFWICTVRDALRATYSAYPFLAYGTDWLAFGHLIIALFFIPPMLDPRRYVMNVRLGVVACFLVIPLALICGPIRGIPMYWRLIDCSFGIFGCIPLFYVLRLIREVEQSAIATPKSDSAQSLVSATQRA